MKSTIAIPLASAAVAACAIFPGPAAAKSTGVVRVNGACTGASTSKLKLSREDGRIQVDFEVDQNRNGVRWGVAIADNGVRVFSGTARTAAPSGSFEVRRVIPDRAGPDHVVANARNLASGERCRAAATI
jgi:hypothetical protein